ncbi:hypothetical protein [Mycobacterium marinum]|uniref:hypothetical protein n=1 Tax=Mycobacterium marinum TaxID=1781 RepID=UPI003FEEB897
MTKPPSVSVSANALAKRAHPQQHAPQVLGNGWVKVEIPPDRIILGRPSVENRWRLVFDAKVARLDWSTITFEMHRDPVSVVADQPDVDAVPVGHSLRPVTSPMDRSHGRIDIEDDAATACGIPL